MRALRIGVVGVGSQGQHYARLCAETSDARLVGISDRRTLWGRRVAEAHGASHHENPLELIGRVDAVCIATPTRSHATIVRAFLDAGVHVLVEKPLCTSSEEGGRLVELARHRGAVLQVGYIERFNPAVVSTFERVRNPRFVTCQRSAPFSLRESDVDIVLDHMVHDLDLLTLLDPSPIVRVEAVGIGALTERHDIVHARLELASGLRAVLVVDRLCIRKIGLLGVWHQDEYTTIDCDAYRAFAYRGRVRPAVPPEEPEASLSPRDYHALRLQRSVDLEEVTFPAVNQIGLAIRSFILSIHRGEVVGGAASGDAALRSLRMAEQVIEALRR